MRLTRNGLMIHNNIMRKFLWLVGALLCCVPARAAVVLKSGNDSFRVKSVRARTVIENGVASTSLVWTFADANRRWKPEAEFYFSAPPRGVVTFFAYWFNGERVVAHVVEREKASAIYNQLSQWGVDPALVELAGKNTFHARIFPVAQNQDVRVEMHLVQPLDATVGGQQWILPLAQRFVAPRRLSKWIPIPPSAAPFYDDVEVDVQCRDKGSANFPQATFSGGHWKAKLRNLAANRDFTLRWRRPIVPLRADMNASRANGHDGYFSLLLCPAHTLRNPRLQIAGVSTFNVFPAHLGTLRAGENVLVCGRFRGAGRATVALEDKARTLRATVAFPARTDGGTAAAKLWASRQLASLGSDERNRARVIALSKQWNLPSAQTSWLAVPSSEKVNFEATKKTAEAQRLSRQIAGDMILGNKSAVEKNRTNLAKLFDAKRWGDKREVWVDGQITDALYWLSRDLGRVIASEELKPDANAPKMKEVRAQLDVAVQEMNLLSVGWWKQSRLTSKNLVSEARQGLLNERTQELAPQYVQAVLDEGKDSPRALELKEQLNFLQLRAGEGNRPNYYVYSEFYQQLNLPLHQLADEKLREEGRSNPDKDKIASIEADMKRLVALASYAGGGAPLQVKKNQLENRILLHLLRDYRDAIDKDTPDERQLTQLHESIANMGDSLPGSKNVLKQLNPSRFETRAARPLIVAEINRQIELFARHGDPLIQVNAPKNAKSVVAIFPDGQVKPLEWNNASQGWEARFDIPTYVSQGTYAVQIVVVGARGERQKITVRFSVQLSSPSKNATLKFDPHHPRLELDCDGATYRVSAFFASGERVELSHEPTGRWSAALPANMSGQGTVRFVLTDAAHNRTEITFDLRNR